MPVGFLVAALLTDGRKRQATERACLRPNDGGFGRYGLRWIVRRVTRRCRYFSVYIEVMRLGVGFEGEC